MLERFGLRLVPRPTAPGYMVFLVSLGAIVAAIVVTGFIGAGAHQGEMLFGAQGAHQHARFRRAGQGPHHFHQAHANAGGVADVIAIDPAIARR